MGAVYILLAVAAYWAVPYAGTRAIHAWGGRGRVTAALGRVLSAWVRAGDFFMKVAFVALAMWVWTFTGWEPPTPENIRKLDAEIEAAARENAAP